MRDPREYLRFGQNVDRQLARWKLEPTLAKVIISGGVIETYRYQKPVFLRKEGEGWQGGRRKAGEGLSDRHEENRRLTAFRNKNKLRRLVNENFDPRDAKFITLTFSDHPEILTKKAERYHFKHFDSNLDIRDPKQTNEAFKLFRKRLHKKFGAFEYLAVIEFQDEKRNGVVHYHMIANLPYIDHRELTEDYWGQGFTLITRIDHVDNIGLYMAKYMGKNMEDMRLTGIKKYNCSKGLKQPTVINGFEAERIETELHKEKKSAKVFEDEYDADFVEKITYSEYNIIRNGRELVKASEEVAKEMQQELYGLYDEILPIY